MNDTIVITDGCDFIWPCFIQQKMKKHVDVHLVNLDNLTHPGSLSDIKEVVADSRYVFVKMYVTDRSITETAFSECRPTKTICIAAGSHLDRSINGLDILMHMNVLDTDAILDGVRRHWQKDDCMDRVRFHLFRDIRWQRERRKRRASL